MNKVKLITERVEALSHRIEGTARAIIRNTVAIKMDANTNDLTVIKLDHYIYALKCISGTFCEEIGLLEEHKYSLKKLNS